MNTHRRTCRRLRRIIGAGDANREIGSGFVSWSCRSCERAGEAKLRGCVESSVGQRWGPEQKKGAALFVFLCFCCWVRVFCILSHGSLPYVCTLFVCAFDALHIVS